MVFSSYVFLFYFLPAVICLYYAAPRGGRHLILTLASYLFYGWANPLFLVLLLASTVVDYFCGLALVGRGPVWLARLIGARRTAERWATPLKPLSADGAFSPSAARGEAESRSEKPWGWGPTALTGAHSQKQRLALACSVVTNLSLLGFFKYFNFAFENLGFFLSWFGVPGLPVEHALQVTLPLGISFYTFQSMSYTIDIYRGRVTPLRNFIDFACYSSRNSWRDRSSVLRRLLISWRYARIRSRNLHGAYPS